MGDVGGDCALTGGRNHDPKEMVARDSYRRACVQRERTLASGSIAVGSQLKWPADVVTKPLDRRRRWWWRLLSVAGSCRGRKNTKRQPQTERRSQHCIPRKLVHD